MRGGIVGEKGRGKREEEIDVVVGVWRKERTRLFTRLWCK
jgi:hypothetical protein